MLEPLNRELSSGIFIIVSAHNGDVEIGVILVKVLLNVAL